MKRILIFILMLAVTCPVFAKWSGYYSARTNQEGLTYDDRYKVKYKKDLLKFDVLNERIDGERFTGGSLDITPWKYIRFEMFDREARSYHTDSIKLFLTIKADKYTLMYGVTGSRINYSEPVGLFYFGIKDKYLEINYSINDTQSITKVKYKREKANLYGLKFTPLLELRQIQPTNKSWFHFKLEVE